MHYKVLFMNNVENDISHIKKMMERSSTFISLSGLSGVAAGIIALVGLAVAIRLLQANGIDYFTDQSFVLEHSLVVQLMIVAILTLVFAIISGMYFTIKKSRKQDLKIWNMTTKAMLQAALIPFLTGGIFCMILLQHQLYQFITPAMLIFYGLALTSCSKYTHAELLTLGMMEIFLGLLGGFWTGFGLILWGIGFGLLHIIYGIYMYKKYK